ncbi:MAG: hypothetical protein R3C01_03935 [Planctomycetaceae bacterium]
MVELFAQLFERIVDVIRCRGLWCGIGLGLSAYLIALVWYAKTSQTRYPILLLVAGTVWIVVTVTVYATSILPTPP